MKDLKNKKILVTGGYGFIGQHLVKRLREKGADVWILSKGVTGEKTVIEDLTNFPKIKEMLNSLKPEYIYHLAGNMSKSEQDLEEVMLVNYEATKNILDSYQAYKKFVYISTSEFYFGNKPPFREDMHVKPTTPYSKSKFACEKYCLGMPIKGKQVVIVRPPIAYGPGQNPGMFMPSLIKSCLNNEEFNMTPGEQTRDFIFVDDLVDFLICAIENDNADGQIINAGSGKPVTLKEVVQLVRKISNSKSKIIFGALPYRENEIMEYYQDINKAKQLFGWAPKTPLEKGLKITIDSYRTTSKQ